MLGFKNEEFEKGCKMVNAMVGLKSRYLPDLLTIRTVTGLSQKKMAAALHCSTTAISLTESGKRNGRLLRRLAWFTYLTYLRNHPENGWIFAALDQPPHSSLCSIPKDEYRELMEKMQEPIPDQEPAVT